MQIAKSCVGVVIVLAILPALGCQVPTSHTTMGWRFEVGRPATMSSPAAISQGPGAMALYPLGAVATASPARPAVLAAEAPQGPTGGMEACPPCQPTAYSVRRGMLAATAPPCDLAEVCARLERLETRVGPPPPPPSMPRALPAGPASEQHP